MKKFILLLTLFCFFILTSRVRADVAVPDFDPQGGSIATPNNTKISMDYENVIITYDKPGKDEMTGHVSAVFKMKNNDSKSVTIPIVFPAQDSEFIGGMNGQKPITNFTVNKKTISKIDSATVTIDGDKKEISTYNWQETFQPNEEKEITITYDVISGKFFNAYFVSYILATGGTWYGPIKAGEISIIFPGKLTDYSVSDALADRSMFYVPINSTLAKQTPIKYTIKDNTIHYNFTNYKPENDVIALGVADFDLVNQTEAQKKLGQDSTSLLKLGNLYQDLSVGVHCFWCVGKAGDLAKSTYFQALDKAETKEQVDAVVLSFTTASREVGTMGSSLEDKYVTNGIPNIEYIKKLMNSEDCDTADAECISGNYGYRNTFGNSPISLDMTTGNIENVDFLQKASLKAKTLNNTSLANAIDTYIKNAPIAFKYLKQKEDEEQKRREDSKANASASNYNQLLQGLIIIVIAIVGITSFLLYKKNVKKVNPLTKTVDNSQSTQPEAVEEDKSTENTHVDIK